MRKRNQQPYGCPVEEAVDKVEEEHQTDMFLYNVDRQKYVELVEQMENDVLQKMDPYPKTSK